MAKHLWKLVVSKRNFFDHINSLKNIFLTFNGEFFHNFILKIKNLLNLPFDKKIEEEINEIHFKDAIYECFYLRKGSEIDMLKQLYSNFKIKLISTGFNYNFESSNVKHLLDKNELSFVGNLNYESTLSSLSFTSVSNQPTTYGGIWNLSVHNVEEEFNMNLNFNVKNFGVSKKSIPMSGQYQLPMKNSEKGGYDESLLGSIMKNNPNNLNNTNMEIDEKIDRIERKHI